MRINNSISTINNMQNIRNQKQNNSKPAFGMNLKYDKNDIPYITDFTNHVMDLLSPIAKKLSPDMDVYAKFTSQQSRLDIQIPPSQDVLAEVSAGSSLGKTDKTDKIILKYGKGILKELSEKYSKVQKTYMNAGKYIDKAENK